MLCSPGALADRNAPSSNPYGVFRCGVELKAMVRTRRRLTVVISLLAGVLAIAPVGAALAETVRGLPAPTGYVNDFAGVLTPQTRQSVEDLCAEEDSLAHAQIAVVTIKTIDPDKSGATPSIEEFATALEEKWKVGAKGTDRGVLMLLVMNPRRGRIEVGYGLEGILNDAKVGDIGREMAPYAQAGDYNQAVLLGVREIAGIISADAGGTQQGTPSSHMYHREPRAQSQLSLTQLLVIGGIVLAVFLVLCATGHVGMAFWLLFNLIGGGRGGGDDERGSGGGGFGGFGGGSSGGGGASGDF